MKNLFYFLALTISIQISAQTGNPPGLKLIREADLKKDLYALADAHFSGRSAGTLDELKASAWLAEQFNAIGLKPAGDDGTYFQFFTLLRKQLANNSSILINDKPLQLWNEAAVSQMANCNIDAPIVYLGNALDLDTSALDVKGKVVAVEANPKGINLDVSLPTWRYNRYIFVKYGMPLVRRGAAAIIFIADEEAEKSWADAAENFKRGTYDLAAKPNLPNSALPPVIWLHTNAKTQFQQGTANAKINLVISTYEYPSVNVVGTVEGTDPNLKSTFCYTAVIRMRTALGT